MAQALIGKKVIITGGSSGIGLATAKRLSSEGAEILIIGRSESKLDKAQNEIGKNCKTHQLDVTNEKTISEFFNSSDNFDHLITPAADAAMGAFLELDSQTAMSLVESKLWGQYYCAKYAAPKLNDGGSITFFSGIAGRKPMAGASTYALIAGAMESLTRTLALELAPIRVNCITPGVIDTPIWSELLPEDIKATQLENIASMLPVKRIGNVDDVAKAAFYTVDNSFVTGSIIDVDGGHRVT